MSPKTQVQQLALETTQESVEKSPAVSSPLLPRKRLEIHPLHGAPKREERNARSERGSPAPGFRGPSRVSAREYAPGGGRRGRKGRAGPRPRAQPTVPPLTRQTTTKRRARATERGATPAWRWPGLRWPPPRSHAPTPPRSTAVPCRCPQSGPWSLRRSVGPTSLRGRTRGCFRGQDGLSVADGEGLGRRAEAAAVASAADAADSPEPEVSRRPCPRDRGAQSAALPAGAEAERRDAAAGWGGEAGPATRLRVHVNTVGRRSPALPPPNHRSRRVGGGRGWEPGAPTRPSCYREATHPGPGSARAPRPPGGAGVAHTVLLACAFCPLSLRGGKGSHTERRRKPLIHVTCPQFFYYLY
ncbi:uncharacterized protein RBU33_004267 [Hipposideros larvatus]